MATYQQRENNGCTAKIRLKGYNESRTFYSLGKKSGEDRAREWAVAEEEKILTGNYKSAKGARTTTLKQALLNYKTKFAKKLKGYEAEKYRIEQWCTWKYADTKLADLTDDMFNKYRDDRREHVKDSTIRLDFAVITAVFSNTNYGISNPAKGTISTLAATEKRDRRFKEEEQKYLLDALFDTECSEPKRANKYLPLVVIFAVETACRLSEIVKDTSEHTTGLLRENVTLDGEKSIAKVYNTKNGTDRYVPLTPIAVEAINHAYLLDASLRGPVFKTTAAAISQCFQRAKKRAIKRYKDLSGKDKGFLVNFHFHDLRHEAASRWKKYLSMSELKDLTGHKDVRSLFRYLHSDEDDFKDMSSKMAKIQNKNRDDGDARIIKFPEKSVNRK